MKLLKELLMERMVAPVFVNDTQTLHVISDLIQQQFGLEAYDGSGGMCFLSQVVFSISAVTGIPAQTIGDYFNKKTDGVTGHSLDDLIKFFSSIKIDHKDKLHSLKLSFEKYKNIEEVVAAVKRGQPVTLITNVGHPLYSQLDDIGRDDSNERIEHPGLMLGFERSKKSDYTVGKKVEEWDRKVFHALLLVGYDSKYKMLIGRESRHSYGYKGYFRLYEKEMKKHFSEFSMLAVTVEEMNSEDIPEGYINYKKFGRALKEQMKNVTTNTKVFSNLEYFQTFSAGENYKGFKITVDSPSSDVVYAAVVYQQSTGKIWIDEKFFDIAKKDPQFTFTLPKSTLELTGEIKKEINEDESEIKFGITDEVIETIDVSVGHAKFQALVKEITISELLKDDEFYKALKRNGAISDETIKSTKKLANKPDLNEDELKLLKKRFGSMVRHCEVYLNSSSDWANNKFYSKEFGTHFGAYIDDEDIDKAIAEKDLFWGEKPKDAGLLGFTRLFLITGL